MSTARPYGFIPARRSAPVPDERYEFRGDLAGGAPRGQAVAYSTDGGDGYAPFRGEPTCVSRTGYYRREHEYDRDGRCFWCDAR